MSYSNNISDIKKFIQLHKNDDFLWCNSVNSNDRSNWILIYHFGRLCILLPLFNILDLRGVAHQYVLEIAELGKLSLILSGPKLPDAEIPGSRQQKENA